MALLVTPPGSAMARGVPGQAAAAAAAAGAALMILALAALVHPRSVLYEPAFEPPPPPPSYETRYTGAPCVHAARRSGARPSSACRPLALGGVARV